MTSQIISTYLDENQLPYPFCPGCGHGKILDSLNQALLNLAIDPHKLVIVTDIGCAGLSDKYFLTNAFHGLHGRSLTYATGIKLANPELKVIILIGDGGCGIGGHHLLNAARRNIGLTTIVFNNLNYGMTGGEHSVTTPLGSFTATTPLGQLEHPLDICGTVIANGASFVARTTTFDRSLPDLITQAIKTEAFSLLDIWELCTAHFVPYNRFSKQHLYRTLDDLSMPTGILANNSKPEFASLYRESQKESLGKPAAVPHPISTRYPHNMSQPAQIILAGAAGAKIGSAASLFAQASIQSGLWASQRNDYPVTVKSGHSISEIIISPHQVRFTGIKQPDLLIVLFPEALPKLERTIAGLAETSALIVAQDIPDIQTAAVKIRLNFQGTRKEQRAIMALTVALKHFNYFPLESFREALGSRPQFAQENFAALDQAVSLYEL
jgi:pyruvate/2-oxoacid:ferredoxin oxidoreductase beta subunit/Pyruvate/2-oxoacid:ferredoxin oxidoreductase gamma subunit